MNTNYFMNMVAGNAFKTQTTPAFPNNLYIGLSTTAPTVVGGNVTEPTGGSYSRVQLSSLSTPSNGSVNNTADISFSEATSSWGNIGYFVIYDASTSGNLLIYGPFSSARQINSGDTVVIKTGRLTLSVQNPV